VAGTAIFYSPAYFMEASAKEKMHGSSDLKNIKYELFGELLI
jgi:hypothetical protein